MRIILQLAVFLLAITCVMGADPAPNWSKPIAVKAQPEPGKLPMPMPVKPASADNGLVPLTPATKLKADIEAFHVLPQGQLRLQFHRSYKTREDRCVQP